MSIGELVFWYASLFCVFLTLFLVVLRRRKAAGKIVFPQPDLGSILQSLKELQGEFWLKIFITLTIALSAGVIIAIFVLPYGTAWALGALLLALLMLVFCLPKILV